MAKSRSPNYPAVSLPVAVTLAKQLYEKEQRSTVSAETAIRAWGYNTMSGRARGKLSALRKYDLLDGRGDTYRVSDRAMAILFPESEASKRAALRAAALSVELFADLSTQVGASDDNLTFRLIRDGFTVAGAKVAVQSYRETMALVSDDGPSYDTGEDEPDPMISPAPTLSTPLPARDRSTPSASDAVFLRYGLIGPVVVELKVTGGAFTSDQIALLREYLTLHEKGVVAAERAASAASSAPQPQPAQSQPDAQD